MIRRILVWTLIVGGAVSTIVSLGLYLEWRQTGDLAPERWQFFLEAYKAIGVGFLVALLGAVIPQILPEARDRFERFKDSRRAYSGAKTSVIYLPEQLACLSFADAVSALRDAHRKLHLAETYSEQLREHLKPWHPHPETWLDRNYWELMGARRVLHLNVDIWPNVTAGRRLELLKEGLKVVEQVFGPHGARWSRMKRADREAEIQAKLDSLQFSSVKGGDAA